MVTERLLTAANFWWRPGGPIGVRRSSPASFVLGVRFGRQPVPPSRLEKVGAALQAGQGVRQAAQSCAGSAAKVSRIKAEMVAAEQLT